MMLTVKELAFRYPHNSEETLKNISFSIQKGEIFGFLGPSGSGKSTTQKILYKLLANYRGEILFKDKPLHEWDRRFYELIGVSFELPNHYIKLSAEENLQFFASFYSRQKDIHELLAKVGLEKDAKKPVSDFSKGMKIRLNFVRSLLHDPELLFLDEPTSGLDPINAAKVKAIIKELQGQGKTIFITTHNMFDADQLCDRVALLDKGEIRALDEPAALKLKFGQEKVKVKQKGKDASEFTYPLNNLGQNEEFLDLLKQNKIATIHSQEATLEEVFIKITGKQLIN